MTRLTRVSLAHRTVIALLALLVSGVGIYVTGVLKQELIPSIDIPRATVIGVYGGASSEVVERDVSKPLEAAVKAVAGVTAVTSVSSSGVSQVKAEWDYGTKTDKVVADIRTAVDGLKATLPAEVVTRVSAGSLSDIPVMVLSVSSDADAATLAAGVRGTVLPRLKTVAGIRDVTVSGEQKRQVTVTLKQDAIDPYGIDVSTLSSFFTANANAIPAGTVLTGTDNLDVLVGRTWTSVEDIKAIRLQGTEGTVELGQVADVAIEPVPSTSISRVNGKQSLTIMVSKTVDGNTVAAAEGVRAALPDLERALGQRTKFSTVFDQSPFIDQSIHDLAVEGGLGLAMAILVILLFLGSIRPTLITAISIPLSLFMAMIGLQLGGYTLNIITLGALTVAIGRVVDDSIVVIENIKRHASLGPLNRDTIIKAVKEVAGAVTSSTLTTVAVFAPIGLVGGQAGELFRPFAVTVTVALLASLLVAMTVVPVLASWFMSRRPRALTAEQQAKADAREASIASREAAEQAKAQAMFETRRAALVTQLKAKGTPQPQIDAKVATLASRYGVSDDQATHDEEHGAPTWLQRAYLPALRWALSHRGLTLALAVAIFAGTLALAPSLKTDFIGDAGQVSVTITADLPSGASLQQTDGAAAKIEAAIASEPAVQTYSTSIGGSSGLLGSGQADTNHARFSVSLFPKSKGTIVADSLRAKLATLSGIGTTQVIVGQSSSNVVVYVAGNDPVKLKAANQQVVEAMKSLDVLSAVTSDLAASRQQLAVAVDVNKAAAAGMTQAQVGLAVTRAVRGQKVGSLNVGDSSLDVLLFSQKPVTTVDALGNVLLPVTAKQTGDARKAAADKATADQTAYADQQKADANTAYASQVQALADSRQKLKTQLADYTSKLSALNTALTQAEAAAAAATAGVLPPVPPLTPQQEAMAQAAAQVAAVKQQIASLTSGIAGLQTQLTAIDTQRQKLAESRQKSLDAQAKQTEITDAAKAAAKVKAAALKLSEVAAVTLVDAPAQVTRVDDERTATITAIPSGTDLGGTSTALKAALDGLSLPKGVTVRIGGVSQQQQDSFAQLGLAMLVAIGIVYLIMVGTFGSLVQPLILLVSVPFAATGALALLLLTNTPLGIASMIGLLMLIGIVVTNAIVLIDLINQFRRRGASVDDAVMHGARLRLRPIIMTAVATIMALVPMGLGVTGGSVFISKPLAIVVIGGLVSSTVLTLVLVPVLYDLLEKTRARWSERRGRSAPVDDSDAEGTLVDA
ncbi:MAG: efflux RND transporter permease subunit [Propionibacteriaceae bacterium]